MRHGHGDRVLPAHLARVPVVLRYQRIRMIAWVVRGAHVDIFRRMRDLHPFERDIRILITVGELILNSRGDPRVLLRLLTAGSGTTRTRANAATCPLLVEADIVTVSEDFAF